MKKPFEAYLTLIESTLEVRLFDWQKEILRAIYDDKHLYWYPGRISGVTQFYRAVEILYEEINRDRGNLPSNLYELDGYTTTVATCDENWGENIIWEKEN